MNFLDKETLYDWGGANVWIFQQVNSLSGETYDHIMLTFSSIARHENFPYYMGGLLAFALLSFIIRKLDKRGGTPHLVAAWFAVFIVLGAGYVTEGFIIHHAKEYFSYPRPYIALGSEVRVLELRNADDNYHSFPSGHVAFITMMVMGLWPALSKNMKWLGVTLVAGVMWSRMALGVHFPADVLGGLIFTFIGMLILRGIIYKILREFGMTC